MLLSGYINLNKIDKSKISEKGFVNLTIGINEDFDQYGNNAAVWLNQTKEEREAKQDRQYVGNAKVVFMKSDEMIKVAPRKEEVTNESFNAARNEAPATSDDSGLPF